MILTEYSRFHNDLLNSEGSILGLVVDLNSDVSYLKCRLTNSSSLVFVPTNRARLTLYFRGIIDLKTLCSLAADEKFIIKHERTYRSEFFECSEGHIPSILNNLHCGNDFYPLLSNSMKSTDEYMELLQFVIRTYPIERHEFKYHSIRPAAFSIFNSDQNIYEIVEFEDEELNPAEYEFIKYKVNDTRSLLIKLTPTLMFLYITNKIGLLDMIELNDTFIISGAEIFKTNYKHIEELKNSIVNHHYYNLPNTIRIDYPIEVYKYYTKLFTINGRGIIEGDFSTSKPVDVMIRKVDNQNKVE